MGDLVLVRAFCQLDFIKGNRYLDDAGKIMNEFEGEFPEKEVGVKGLTMVNRDSPLRRAFVSVDRVWTGFEEPDTLTFVADQAWRVFKTVCEIIEVSEAKRFGIRFEHLYPLRLEGDALAGAIRSTATRAVGASLLAAVPENLSSFEAILDSTWKDVGVRLQLAPVRRLVEPESPDGLPDHAIMFDADIHREAKSMPVSDARRLFRAGVEWITEEFPGVAKAVLGEVWDA